MIFQFDQPAGLGDILFCQKLAHVCVQNGNQVYWPLHKHYQYIEEYISYPGINFTSTSNYDELIPLCNASLILDMTDKIMDSKYKLCKVDYADWQDYLVIRRNSERESRVYNELNINEPYNLICERYSTGSQQRISIPINNNLRNIYIEHDNYHIFDWCTVIERATNLFFVDTSFPYIIDKLTINAEGKYMFSRNFNLNGTPSFNQTKHLFKTNWKYIHKVIEL